MIVGYKLLNEADDTIAQTWGGVWGQCPAIPNPLILPTGAHVCAASLASYDGYRLEPWEMDPPVNTLFDGAEFLERVTDDEYAAITSSGNVQVQRWLDVFRLRGEIDVAGTTAQAAKAGLVALGLLTQARADIIFAAQ